MTVELPKYVQKRIRKLDHQDRTAIETVIAELSQLEDFGRFDVMRGSTFSRVKAQTVFKARLGKMRVLFTLTGDVVEIVAAGYRKDVYESLPGRHTN